MSDKTPSEVTIENIAELLSDFPLYRRIKIPYEYSFPNVLIGQTF